jgi:hypothetical protein
LLPSRPKAMRRPLPAFLSVPGKVGTWSSPWLGFWVLSVPTDSIWGNT